MDVGPTIEVKYIVERVAGQWVPSHCSSAKTKLLSMLGLLGMENIVLAVNDGGAMDSLRVRVETAAGVIVAQLRMKEDATVGDVKNAVAQVAPRYPALAQQLLLLGHERHGVLKDASVLKTTARQFAAESFTEHSRLGASSTDSDKGCGPAIRSEDAVCLCLCVATPRWQVPTAQQEVIVTNDRRCVERPRSLGRYIYACGALILQQPGHFFSVRIKKVKTISTRLGIGVGYVWESTNGRVMIWRNDVVSPGTFMQVGDKTNTRLPNLTAWQPGDEVTVTLGSSAKGELTVKFAINSKHVHEAIAPTSLKLPVFPLCTVAVKSCLELVGGLGVPVV